MRLLFTGLIFILFVFLPAIMSGQKVFSEGIIRYDVFVNNDAKPGGVYVISVKGGNVKRELAMNNGYSNITIYYVKTGKTFSYNIADEHKFALELSPEELKEKNQKFESAKFIDLNKTKKIAGLQCAGYKVSYASKEDAEFFASTDLLAPAENFNAMFPGLKGIPLEYEVKSSGTMAFRFVATLVDAMVIDSKIFALPTDFKIVTKNELDKLK